MALSSRDLGYVTKNRRDEIQQLKITKLWVFFLLILKHIKDKNFLLLFFFLNFVFGDIENYDNMNIIIITWSIQLHNEVEYI